MSDAIVVENLVKRFPAYLPGRAARTALDGLDLRVPTGGVTGLLGPNGSGKTTTIRILLGVIKPTSGRARLLGSDAWRESRKARDSVAYVPAERTVFDWMRVRTFIAGVAELSRQWDAAYADQLVNRWDIDGRATLGELSTGARSKLMLIVALARRPEVLLLDEPTTGLDPAASDEALSELVGFAADGATILLLTHQIEVVDRICDKVTIMSGGRSVLTADLDELRSSWAVIDVVGAARPELMQQWSEVTSVSDHEEYTRLLVHADPSAVADRLRLLGAEVAAMRPLSLREVYLAVTPRLTGDNLTDAEKNHLA